MGWSDEGDAAAVALRDAGREAREIDLVIELGMTWTARHTPNVRLDAGASVASGVALAAQVIASGTCDDVLIVAAARPGGARDEAALARAYCRKHGRSLESYDEAMFELARTRRLHGALAGLGETLEMEARRRQFASEEALWRSGTVKPTPAIGSTAIVVTRAADDAAVRVLGIGGATGNGIDPIDRACVSIAAARAFEMACAGARDVDYLDAPGALASLCIAEQLGYLPVSEALRVAALGRTRFDRDRAMATSGGSHASDDASGGRSVCEAIVQLRGRAGARQLSRRPQRAAIVATDDDSATVLVLGK
ncbi:MAG: hypothetical protein ABI678_00455 [Kofleriaceae bacterium]